MHGHTTLLGYSTGVRGDISVKINTQIYMQLMEKIVVLYSRFFRWSNILLAKFWLGLIFVTELFNRQNNFSKSNF